MFSLLTYFSDVFIFDRFDLKQFHFCQLITLNAKITLYYYYIYYYHIMALIIITNGNESNQVLSTKVLSFTTPPAFQQILPATSR